MNYSTCLARLFLLAVVLLSAFSSEPALATCSNPPGNAGDVFYSSPLNLLAYCNSTNWVAMGSASTTTFGTLTTNDFCTAASSSSIQCTTAYTGSGQCGAGDVAAPDGRYG